MGFSFQPYPETFSSTAMLERQELYRQLCELVWAPSECGISERITEPELS